MLAGLSQIHDERNSYPPAASGFDDHVRGFEIKLIRRALRQTGGNQRRAAQLLKIKAIRLNYKIKLYKITC